MTAVENTATRPAILLVDDDDDARRVLREALAEAVAAATVHEVASGEEALDFLYARGPYAAAPRPALIYLDIEMPGAGGQTALARIRQDRQFADIPVVVLTSMTDDVQQRLATVNGADGFAVKPATPAQLADTVGRIAATWTALHPRGDREETDGS